MVRGNGFGNSGRLILIDVHRGLSDGMGCGFEVLVGGMPRRWNLGGLGSFEFARGCRVRAATRHGAIGQGKLGRGGGMHFDTGGRGDARGLFSATGRAGPRSGCFGGIRGGCDLFGSGHGNERFGSELQRTGRRCAGRDGKPPFGTIRGETCSNQRRATTGSLRGQERPMQAGPQGEFSFGARLEAIGGGTP